MTLSKSKKGFLAVSVMPLVVLFGCSGKDSPAGGGGAAAGVYPPAPAADGVSTACWVVDRVEGADAGGIAVLEDLEALRAEERPVKALPEGVGEGRVLTGGGAPRVDDEAAAVRAAWIGERFKRLKAD